MTQLPPVSVRCPNRACAKDVAAAGGRACPCGGLHVRRARKSHACNRCRRPLEVGRLYVEVMFWNDDIYHPPRYHFVCFEREIAS